MTPSYCPHCGAPLAQRELDARPGLRRVPDDAGNVHRFRLGDGAADTGATWQEFRRPARPANVASDVATPALQSTVTAAAAAFVAIVPAVAFDLSWLVVPTAGALAFALSWAALLRDGRASLWADSRARWPVLRQAGRAPALDVQAASRGSRPVINLRFVAGRLWRTAARPVLWAVRVPGGYCPE